MAKKKTTDQPAEDTTPKKTRPRKSSAKKKLEPDYIAADLWPLAVPIEELNPDPANARTHGERNLQTLRSSIEQFGQRTPIVVNRRGNIIEKGNGTWAAMKSAGKTHIAVVWVDDDPMTQAGYAIADNRTAELAGWDVEALEAQLKALGETDFDITSIGFNDDELAAIIESAIDEPESENTQTESAPSNSTADGAESEDLPEKYQILIECDGEPQQKKLLARLDGEGFTCRALIT